MCSANNEKWKNTNNKRNKTTKIRKESEIQERRKTVKYLV